MIDRIKTKIEQELSVYFDRRPTTHSLHTISPLLFNNIAQFARRDGKRIRPILFVLGYLGFSGKPARGLYTSAVSIELLHDFMLIHDDIIDKSDTRRGKPSMHTMYNNFLRAKTGVKFYGEDLAIITGDVLYAMAIHSFLAIQEEPRRKEAALRKLIEAALFTGSGEFIELIKGLKDIAHMPKSDIYQIYDLKTANYTFSSPLIIGATLAGAHERETRILKDFGIKVGRAFQIKDDILGIFGDEKKIGKSILTDLQEAKKTLLVWYAWRASGKTQKRQIQNILKKANAKKSDLFIMRDIIQNSGSLKYAKDEIQRLLADAHRIYEKSKMNLPYKDLVIRYAQKILNV